MKTFFFFWSSPNFQDKFSSSAREDLFFAVICVRFHISICGLHPPILNWSPTKFRPPIPPIKNPKSDCEDLFFGLRVCDLWFPQSKILATPLGEDKLRLAVSEEGRRKNVLPLRFCAWYSGKLVG